MRECRDMHKMNIDKAGYCIFMRFYMFSYVLFVFVSRASYCMYVFISVAATSKRNKILIDFIIFAATYILLSLSLMCIVSGGTSPIASVKTCNKDLGVQTKLYKHSCVVTLLYP